MKTKFKKTFQAQAYHAHTAQAVAFIDVVNIFADHTKPKSQCFNSNRKPPVQAKLFKGATW